MSMEQWRWMCFAGSTALLVLGLGLLVWFTLGTLPLEARSDAAVQGPVRPVAVATSAARAERTAPSAPPLKAIAQLDLRQTLFPSPTPEPASQVVAPEPAPPPPPPLRVHLVATAMEASGSYAVLLDERQQVQVRRMNERIGDAVLTKIDADLVELEHHGQLVTLRVPEAYSGPMPSVSNKE